MTESGVVEVLEHLHELEPFPPLALEVEELALLEETGPEDLIAVIRHDIGLTSRVLKLCNSAFYGFRRQIHCIEEAGNMLGVRTLSNLVVTTSSARYFRGVSSSAKRLKTRWEHAIAGALAAERVSLHLGVNPKRAFTSGLLSDVGRLVLDRYHLERDENPPEMPLDPVMERRLYKLDHAELGARLVERWGFPDAMVSAIRHHHDGPSDKHSDDSGTAAEDALRQCLAIGGELAQAMIAGRPLDEIECPLDEDELEDLASDLAEKLRHAADMIDP